MPRKISMATAMTMPPFFTGCFSLSNKAAQVASLVLQMGGLPWNAHHSTGSPLRALHLSCFFLYVICRSCGEDLS
ncbi:unnamed protein product [Victoria cruziana]